MNQLERAIAIAVEAHGGQTDKAGAPYILHPLRVMFAVNGEHERTVAVLYDVVEDCPDWPLSHLTAEGFDAAVIDGVEAMTKRDGEVYLDFVARAGANRIARRVKIADLEDNMDMSRLPLAHAADTDRLERYRSALTLLTAL